MACAMQGDPGRSRSQTPGTDLPFAGPECIATGHIVLPSGIAVRLVYDLDMGCQHHQGLAWKRGTFFEQTCVPL
jgi:hypothetical protein